MPAMEIWKDVPGYEGAYQASNLGNVRSLDRIVTRSDGVSAYTKGKVLKPTYNKKTKYHKVTFAGKQFNLHTVIYMTFYGPIPKGMVVRHGIKGSLDNSIENLSIGTQSDNELDKIRDGTHFQAIKTHCARGHAFIGYNIKINTVTGSRGCRSCHAAYDYVKNHPEANFQEIADKKFLTYSKA